LLDISLIYMYQILHIMNTKHTLQVLAQETLSHETLPQEASKCSFESIITTTKTYMSPKSSVTHTTMVIPKIKCLNNAKTIPYKSIFDQD
jgi:hypothetical protein